jgi:hypothetical protein
MGAMKQAARQVDATASLLEQAIALAMTSGIRIKLDGLPPLLARIVGSDISLVLTICEAAEEPDPNPANEAQG